MVKVIASGAFDNCIGLTSINIGNSVTSIEGLAFGSCNKLTSVRIPNSVTQIENTAFSNCTSLKSVTVERVRPISIVRDVFYNVVPTSSATLFVPLGSAAAYKDAPVWRLFGTITEGIILPLNLVSLSAKSIAIGNQIKWSTTNIVNVKTIIVERSGFNNNFSSLVTLPANSTQFVDINPLAGNNYYRLSSTDIDGTTKTYGKIGSVSLSV